MATVRNMLNGKPALEEKNTQAGWISRERGVGLIAVLSIGMALLTGWQLIPAVGWVKGGLVALGLGGGIWLVFFVMSIIYRVLR